MSVFITFTVGRPLTSFRCSLFCLHFALSMEPMSRAVFKQRRSKDPVMVERGCRGLRFESSRRSERKCSQHIQSRQKNLAAIGHRSFSSCYIGTLFAGTCLLVIYFTNVGTTLLPILLDLYLMYTCYLSYFICT